MLTRVALMQEQSAGAKGLCECGHRLIRTMTQRKSWVEAGEVWNFCG